MKFSDSTLIFVGGLVLFIAGAVIKQWFTRFVNKKFDDLNESQLRGRKEREYDNYLLFLGQRVITDNLHELNYAVIHGHHNGELEKVNNELDDYRNLLNKNIVEKAARWNIQIETK